MTRDEILAQIDQRLGAKLPELQAKQAAYFAAHGRYWQGLESHSVPPADGAETAPDRAAAHPADQAESWLDVGGLPATSMSRVRVDVYEGPQGQGYVLTTEVTIAGRRWAKTLNVGPETYRGHGWQDVTPEPGLLF